MHPDHRSSSSSPIAAGGGDGGDGDDGDAGGKDRQETAQWTEEEEEKLLRAALEIAREPVESFDASISPVDRVRRAVGGEFTAKEIVRKTKQLRKRYEEMCCRRLTSGGRADADIFGVVFEISDQIWGCHGREGEKEKEDGTKRGQTAV